MFAQRVVVQPRSLLQFLKENKLYSAFGASVVAFVYCAYKRYLFRKARRKETNKAVVERKVKPFSEVIFFSDKNELCKSHQFDMRVCSFPECSFGKLQKLINYLDMAVHSLDICVLTITSEPLADVIIRKYHEGVRVRIITDFSLWFNTGSQIRNFRKEGIRVRAKKSTFLMHHKFAVIDSRILVNGSFNWTAQASFGNWENLVIANTPQSTVKTFENHFEELWKHLDKLGY